MAKYPTYPTLYDDVLQISISKLKEWKYLDSESIKSGTINWSRNGTQTASTSIKVNTIEGYIELDYKSNGEPIKYKIHLESKPSNLGVGKVWYFRCPNTNKLCRKLYCIGGYFLHRDAFNGCMYESQTKSKSYRQMEKTFGVLFSTDKLYEELYSKHFKKYYAGKPTKRYKKINAKLHAASELDYAGLKRMLY